MQPFASLIDKVPDYVPRLLINREVSGVHNSKSSGFDFKWKYGLNRDVSYIGSCDDGVEELAKLLGWEKELEKLYTKGNEKLKAIWKDQELLVEEAEKEVVENKEDKEVDLLAKELEKLTADDESHGNQ